MNRGLIFLLSVSDTWVTDWLNNVVDFRPQAQDTHFEISKHLPTTGSSIGSVCDNNTVLSMSIIIYLKPGQLLKMTTLLKNHPTFQFLDLIII